MANTNSKEEARPTIESGGATVHNTSTIHPPPLPKNFWLEHPVKWNDRLITILHQLGRHSEASRISDCTNSFKSYKRSLRDGGKRFFKPCRHPLCAPCSITRRKRLFKTWEEAVWEMEQPVFITLNFLSVEYLQEEPKEMGRLFSIFRRREIFQEHCRGGLFNMEFEYNEDADNFHPHIHILAECAPGLTEARLSNEWKGLTGSYVNDLKTLGVSDDARRTLEYILKPPCLSLNKRVVSEISQSIRGIRRFRAFGNFYGKGQMGVRDGNDGLFDDSGSVTVGPEEDVEFDKLLAEIRAKRNDGGVA